VKQRALLVIRHTHEEIGSGTGTDPLQLFNERLPLSASQQVSQFLRLLTIHHARAYYVFTATAKGHRLSAVREYYGIVTQRKLPGTILRT
jgi:hypothetical protein